MNTEDVSDKLNEIKQLMPEVYKMIKDRAAVDGNIVYELVRRGLRGEPNCFYAWEGGRIVGARFIHVKDFDYHLALGVIEFGPASICLVNVAGTGRA